MEDARLANLEKQKQLQHKRLEGIALVKKEKKLIQKRRLQMDKVQLKKNQERRLEIQYQHREAHERVESLKRKFIEDKGRLKEKLIFDEAKRIKKQERQARQLEIKEAEIV